MIEEEPRPRSGGFYERWALLNLGLLLALIMAALAVRSEESAAQPKPWREILQLNTVLVWFPANVVYLIGSLHLKIKNEWHDHRLLLIVLLLAGVIWTFILHK